jgi:phage recombination protein Bet
LSAKKTNDKAISKVHTKNALTLLAERYSVPAEQLKTTLKETVIKGATDAQFITFCAVANEYKLNPMTREIFAFPDRRQGIIPIVSTDGWTKLITSHPKYKNHTFNYSDDTVSLDDAKPCPEWIECIIQKVDATGEEQSITVREYLDECYRPPIVKDQKKIMTPWQTHTKRMLRHKVKIQAGREAFGFGGIYDKDESERIAEGQIVEGEVEDQKMIESIKETTPPPNEKKNGSPEKTPPDQEASEPPDVSSLPLRSDQHRTIMKNFTTLEMGGHDAQARGRRLHFIEGFAGIKVESTKDLTEEQAENVISVQEKHIKNMAKK